MNTTTETALASSRFHPAELLAHTLRAVLFTTSMLAAAYSIEGSLLAAMVVVAWAAWTTSHPLSILAGIPILWLFGYQRPLALAVTLIPVAVWLVWRTLTFTQRRFTITTHRLLLEEGVFSKKVGAQPLRALTDMTKTVTLPGMLFGYVHLDVESAGQDQALKHLRFVPGVAGNPDHYYDLIVATTQREPRRF